MERGIARSRIGVVVIEQDGRRRWWSGWSAGCANRSTASSPPGPRSTKAHDEAQACQVGDRVRIVETRPLSKDKRWRVAETAWMKLGRGGLGRES